MIKYWHQHKTFQKQQMKYDKINLQLLFVRLLLFVRHIFLCDHFSYTSADIAANYENIEIQIV